MSKWTKTRRDPGRTYTDAEKIQRRNRLLARIPELVESGIEAEREVVIAAREANGDITPQQLQEIILLFRDAVYERQQRDLRRH
jgi:hypothetical protein